MSGYYVAQVKLTSGEQVGHAFTIPLIVRAPATRAKTMLVQASSNTWQAYNQWGGKRVEAGSLGDPWFSGTGFLPGATIPLVIGYEWDDIVPDCAVPGPLTVLLRYDGGAAEPSAGATRYTAPSGARVFAAGTMTWSWKLDDYVQVGYDPVGHGVDARVQSSSSSSAGAARPGP